MASLAVDPPGTFRIVGAAKQAPSGAAAKPRGRKAKSPKAERKG